MGVYTHIRYTSVSLSFVTLARSRGHLGASLKEATKHTKQLSNRMKKLVLRQNMANMFEHWCLMVSLVSGCQPSEDEPTQCDRQSLQLFADTGSQKDGAVWGMNARYSSWLQWGQHGADKALFELVPNGSRWVSISRVVVLRSSLWHVCAGFDLVCHCVSQLLPLRPLT